MSTSHYRRVTEIELEGSLEELQVMMPAVQAAIGAALQALNTVTSPLLAAQVFNHLKETPQLQVQFQTLGGTIQTALPAPQAKALPHVERNMHGDVQNESR